MGTPASHYMQPSRQFAAAVPSDTTVLGGDIREVVCLTAGNLIATNFNDADVTFPLSAGQTLRINPKKIKAATTGTYALLR